MLNMIGILLLMSFAEFKVIALNSKLPEGLDTLWLNNQVMIYHNSEPSADFSFQEPDCSGNFLTKNHVITAASCFVELNYELQCYERNRKQQGKGQISPPKLLEKNGQDLKRARNIINFDSIKKSIKIEKTLIAQVCYKVKYLLSVKWVIQILLSIRLPQMYVINMTPKNGKLTM